MTKCKSCGANITWKMTVNSMRIPLDAEPCDDGNIVVSGIMAVMLTKEMMAPGVIEGLRYKSHFATCPKAKQHRRRK